MHSCYYLGGAGLPFRPGIVHRLGIGRDHIRLALMDGSVILDVPFELVISATPYGDGAVRTGGGVIGGGFGLEGAAEGMLIAAALNALTTKTTVHSFLRLVTTTGEGIFAFTESPPQQLDLELAQLRVYQRNVGLPGTQHAALPSATPGPDVSPAAVFVDIAERRLAALERLARLRTDGVLSEQEFEQQKQQLLSE